MRKVVRGIEEIRAGISWSDQRYDRLRHSSALVVHATWNIQTYPLHGVLSYDSVVLYNVRSFVGMSLLSV